MQNGMAIHQTLERMDRCADKGLCFISLRPLDLRSKVVIKSPVHGVVDLARGAGKVAVHKQFVTQEMYVSGMVTDGAENLDNAITHGDKFLRD